MRAQAYIIHLKRAEARRGQVERLSAAIHWPVRLMPAIDGACLSAAEIDAVYRPGLFRPRYPFSLRASEVACFLSHRAAWQAILDAGIEAGLIIEDDVVCDPRRFRAAIDMALAGMQRSDVIRLPVSPRGDRGPIVAGSDGLALHRPALPGLGMQAQIVGREAAARLLAATRVFDRPVDNLVQMQWLHGARVLALQPAVVEEVSARLGGSLLHPSELPLADKLRREALRPLHRLRFGLENRRRQQAAAAALVDNLIVTKTSRYGLGQDARLLADHLKADGQTVAIVDRRARPVLDLIAGRLAARRTIHLEGLAPRFLGAALETVLIPNQEWFRLVHKPLLVRVDRVLAKTEAGARAFAPFAAPVYRLGFTSRDRLDRTVARDHRRMLHLAGGSFLKGTDALLRAWARNPHWPTLILIENNRATPREVPANVQLIGEFLDDAALRELQNSCGIHLCPSEVEGWGHHLVEAMSCGAVVLTTDAAPMNELVRPDCGILVPTAGQTPRKLGMRHFVDDAALEAAIGALLALPDAALIAMGAAARRAYDAIDARFRAALRDLLPPPGPALPASVARLTDRAGNWSKDARDGIIPR
jgi:GR25 family glycosyltransferase involved in LPS biosynthesis